MQWNDKQPIYLQLKEFVMVAVLDSTMAEGESIPSIRQTSTTYNVNPITVSKAYQALVDDNIIEMRRGMGMFVKKGARARLLQLEKKRFLKEEWPRVLDKINSLGLSIKELIK